MLTDPKILDIADAAQRHFKLDCEIKILPYDRFKKIALKSPLIVEVLEEGFSFRELEIPALIYHEEKEHIYLCKKIINELTRNYDKKTQEEFVKAVLYHELFHILEKNKVKRKNFSQCLKSEERICRDFKRKFPHLFNESKEIHKKATSF